MSLQSPLFEVSSPSGVSQQVYAPPMKRSGSTQIRTLAIIATALLILNGVLIGMVVKEYNRAAPVIDQANRVMGGVQDLMEYPSRLIHGSVTRSLSSLLRTDYESLARNTTKLSQSIQDLFDLTSTDSGMLFVAQYASLVTSIAGKVGSIRPSFKPYDKPSDDLGLVNIFSYLTQWATQQVDRKEVGSTATACEQWLDSALNIDWSATYSWGHDGQVGSWDANGVKDTAIRVHDYCDRLSRLPPSADGSISADDEAAADAVANEINSVAMRLRKMVQPKA